MQIFKFWGRRGVNVKIHHRDPQRALRLTYRSWKSVHCAWRPVGEVKERKKGKKESHIKQWYFTHAPRPPRRPITPIFGSWGRVLDVVTHSKFNGDRFRGFAPRGSRKSHFSYTYIYSALAYTTGLGYRPTCELLTVVQYNILKNCKQFI